MIRRRLPDTRASAARRGYGHRWRKLRARKLKKDPLCEMHLEAGRVVAATMVDHIVPHEGREELMLDEENLQSMCTSCHNFKTGRERTERGRG
ncbi:MAG: HNH endonuclease [Planctomycetota bacterium]|jgi:5-methylcytosine-specific restriction protein A